MELNVFFEDPFWIGMFYVNDGNDIYIEKVVFGSEPKDGEIYKFILYNYYSLSFKAFYHQRVKNKPKNPKRMQRIIKKQSSNLSVGTKSMQALKKQYEQNKQIKKSNQKELEKDKKDYLFHLKQKKRKAKKRGH
ncbi:YjdF family protein [Thomasclavelia sp.]